MKDNKPFTQNNNKKHYLYSIIERGEGNNLDFKFEISDASKIARSLAAFANTNGGKLLVGVKDNGVIAGVRSEEEFYMIQAAAEMYSKPKIFFQTKSWNINGKNVLEIDIPKSKNIPHYAPDDQKKWKAWVRVNDQNIMANDIIHEIWNLSKTTKGIFLDYDKKESILLEYLTNNHSIDLDNYCKIAVISKQIAVKILGKLVVLKIIQHKLTENGSLFMIHKNFDLQIYKNNL